MRWGFVSCRLWSPTEWPCIYLLVFLLRGLTECAAGSQDATGLVVPGSNALLPVSLRSDHGICSCHMGNMTGEGDQL